MWKRVSGLSVSIVLLTVFSAEADSEFGQELGGYLAVSGMYVHDTSDSELEGLAGDSGGVTGRVGYRMAPMAAIEIQGDWNYTLAQKNDPGGFAITANLRVYPLTGVIDGLIESSWFEHRIQPYVVVGLGLITANVWHQRGGVDRFDRVLSGAWRVGGGIDFYLTERIALSAGTEWVDGMGRLNDLNS
jgi:opacity protein-like surface antigen